MSRMLGTEIDVEYVTSNCQKGQELAVVEVELFGSIGQIAPVQDYIDENGLIKNNSSFGYN